MYNKAMSYTLNDLFLQLGLPNDNASITAFITRHQISSKRMTGGKDSAKTPAAITAAPWWTASQSEFLHQAIQDDAEWAILVDELNTRLTRLR